MPNHYVSPWMSGKDALAHIMLAEGCEIGCALKQLQQKCRDGQVKGRERGGDADARRDFLDMRGFRQDEHAWRMRFIDRGPRVERDFDLFLKTFGEQSEFCRRDVLSTWPGTDNDGRAHTQEKPTSTVPGSKIPGNTTGPRPEKRKAIIERMISDYANAPEKLENEKQEVLATKYGAARSTVQKARPDALEYLRRNSDK